MGGAIVDGGTFDWGAHADKFPQFHVDGEAEGSGEVSLWKMFGRRAFSLRCQFEVLRDIGSTMSPQAAQQLLIGLESLAVRCDRHKENIEALAAWLAERPQVAWVRYLGQDDHPSHRNASKYLQRGYGAVFSFGIVGGKEAGFRLCDGLKMVINTAKYVCCCCCVFVHCCTDVTDELLYSVGDSKTLVAHPWTTTHQQLTDTERFAAGVTEDHIRLSVGIEHIEDIKEDFRQAFALLGQPTSAKQSTVLRNNEQEKIIYSLFGPNPGSDIVSQA